MEENNKNVETAGTGTTETEEKKTYSEQEVLSIVQREADKRVTQALKKQAAKFEKQQSEAEKLRTMDETQRKEYEFNLKLEEFEKQKKEFAITQNKLEASKVMAERNLPIQFVDYIVAEDAETMIDNITTFEKAFKAAVADAVATRISTGTPKSATAKQTGLTKEEFKKMSLAQKSELYSLNSKLFKELSSR